MTFALPAATMIGTYSVVASYGGGETFTPGVDSTHVLKVYPATTITSANNISLPFSSNARSVTLSASVTSSAGIVNGGTVTFNVISNGIPFGSSAVSNVVVAGNATAIYWLPAGTATGLYTIVADYTASGGFGSSSDGTHGITLYSAPTSTVGSSASAVRSDISQTVALYATVTSTAGLVTEGTVRFTILDNGTAIGSPATSPTVTNGTAMVSYVLPANTPAGTYQIQATYSGGENFAASSNGSVAFTVTQSVSSPGALMFIPLTPCRVADTRDANGSFGGPQLVGGMTRNFVIPNSGCGVPSTAVAYSLNVTVVPNATLTYLTMWPAGEAQPMVSTLNSLDGRIKANAAIVPAGSNGAVSIYVTDATQAILDVNGYFVPAGTASSLAFYPVAPCRIVDTRMGIGPLAGPSLSGGTSRSFPILSSACNIPSTAQAYSLNFTTVPKEPLYYLTAWPTGQSQPNVSTLNAPTGAVTANAAILAAGIDGSISVYSSNDTDLILDVNGYFGAPGGGGLSLYTLTPCRVLDTRIGSQPLNGTLVVNVAGSTCGVPATAQAYTLNATVIPTSTLEYMTLWSDGKMQPLVSSLNSWDGAITSNMAIVPTINGSIDAFLSDSTDLILDISSFFAAP